MSSIVDQRLVGAHVRRLRAAARLSVRALAEAAGFSPSFISQVENGQVSPSIHSMEKIVSSLGVTLGAFFGALQPSNATPIARAADRQSAESSWSRGRVEVIGPLPPHGEFEPLLITLLPRGRSGKEAVTHPRDVFAFVLEGRVTLQLGDDEHQMGVGDAVVLGASTPRLWSNTSARRCRVLIVARSG